MEVSKLEGKEVLTMLFGLPIMITVIVLASIVVGHIVTVRSNIPTQVNVAATPPNVDMKPEVHVTSAPVTVHPATIEVNVPQQLPPTVNVTPQAPIVTLVNKLQNGELRLEPSKDSSPAKLETPKPPAPLPAAVPALAKPAVTPLGSSSTEKEAPKAPVKSLTIDDLYAAAEKYLDVHCRKNSMDPQKEREKWEKKWRDDLNQAVADNSATDEQNYINRVVVEKRDCFDIEKATPEKIVEGCRILLRYRDGKLALLSALQEKVTSENLQKTITFLAATTPK